MKSTNIHPVTRKDIHMSLDMSRREYWEEVSSLAKSITEECLDGFDAKTQAEIQKDNHHDAFREALDERTWETIDGHQWVIYTHYNFDIMRFSDNSGYSAENFGSESIIKDGQLDTAAIAFGGLYADVTEHADYGVVNEP